MKTAEAMSINYFGKLPSQGDFVKTNRNHQLLAMLDRWAGGGMGLLSEATGWKTTYDKAPPIHFAFVGTRSRTVVGGHFVPSHDASQRRFPFMAATRLEVSQPLAFMARMPLALSRLWAVTERHCHAAVAAEDAGEALQTLADVQVDVTTDAQACSAPYDEFLDSETVGSLQAMLEEAGHEVSVRNIILGVGALMDPVRASGATQLQKGLVLPLPTVRRHLVASLWCDLLIGFLGHANFELAVLLDCSAMPTLTVGFNGAHDRALHSALDVHVSGDYNVVLTTVQWADESVAQEYAMKKLASYLDHDGLSLRMARDTFVETFHGS